MKTSTVILFFVLLSFWLLLAGFDWAGLPIGIIFIFFALVLSNVLANVLGEGKQSAKQKIRVNWGKVPSFIIFFLVNSVKGGINTAALAFSDTQKLAPDFIHYKITKLHNSVSVSLFMNLISLLPGSVSVVKEKNGVLVHVLDKNANTLEELNECETMVSNLIADSTVQIAPFKSLQRRN